MLRWLLASIIAGALACATAPPVDASVAIGARDALHRGDSVTSSGPFARVPARTTAGRKIIHDHTNADPEQP